MRILLVDNNDSFTRNLEHLLFTATANRPQVLLYGDILSVSPQAYDLIVISPGPGHPSEYPDYARFIDSGVPVLGICMGMQVLNIHFGGTVSRLPDKSGGVHGKQGSIMLEGEVEPRLVARYHSLHCSRLGEGLRMTATLCDPASQNVVQVDTAPSSDGTASFGVSLGTESPDSAGSVGTERNMDAADRNISGNDASRPLVMALAHGSRPLMGYQFHPESFLTPDGTWYIEHALHFFRSCQ